MSYVVKRVSEEDQARIVAEAGEGKRRRFGTKNEFFEMNSDLLWAIDEETGHYLVKAPQFAPTSLDRFFFMYFEGRMYDVRVLNYSGPAVAVGNPPEDPSTLARLQSEIAAAFQVHGLNGRPFVPAFHQSKGASHGN